MGRGRRHRPGPRRRPARRRAHRRRHRRRRHRDPADRPARGRGLHRLGRRGAADRRPARDRAVDAARGHQRQGGARPAAGRGRRRRRLRDGHGLAGARLRRSRCIELGERLLPPLEPAAGEAVAASLREAGVDVRLGTGVTAARREGTEVVLTTRGRRGARRRGAGRRRPPGADARTSASTPSAWSPGSTSTSTTRCRCAGRPWLYGVGDVNGRRLLTHMGKYQARQAGAAIVARARGEQVRHRRLVAVRRHRRRTSRRRRSCSPTRRSPASGGPSAEAEEAGLPHRVVEYPIGNVVRGRRCSPTATPGRRSRSSTPSARCCSA